MPATAIRPVESSTSDAGSGTEGLLLLKAIDVVSRIVDAVV